MASGPIVKETLASVLLPSYEIRIHSYIPFGTYLSFNVAFQPVVEPASIYSRIPWIPIVLRFSNHHFRILARRSVSNDGYYRYRFRYREPYLRKF